MLITKARFPIKQMVLTGWWPGFLKKALYRLKGYKIGRKVSISFGSVIVGEDVVIGDHASISFLSFVRGRHIRIGAHVQIGAMTFIDTPNFEIGDGSKINEQVFIGGLQFPDSKLIIGRNCQIMQMSFINPARSITIGDDSGIGGDCLLFGHTSWLSQLEGYKVDFESIEIGTSVSLSWRVFVLPGVKIGDGAVIGANSLVSATIPPKCLAIGYPARVVSKFPDFPRDLSAEERSALFANMIKEMLLFFEASGLHPEGTGPDYTFFPTDKRGRKRGKGWRLHLDREAREYGLADVPEVGADVFVRFHEISDAGRKALGRRGVAWFDVEHKERSEATNELADEVALFLRRYGIRFFRVKK
jgi:acetyltransferase-like isoleucine patch superfamily enzyme/cold shock CspA family protein